MTAFLISAPPLTARVMVGAPPLTARVLGRRTAADRPCVRHCTHAIPPPPHCSPYPDNYCGDQLREDKLYLCEFCLRYMRKVRAAHMAPPPTRPSASASLVHECVCAWAWVRAGQHAGATQGKVRPPPPARCVGECDCEARVQEGGREGEGVIACVWAWVCVRRGRDLPRRRAVCV
jgi:hypothetical protein